LAFQTLVFVWGSADRLLIRVSFLSVQPAKMA